MDNCDLVSVVMPSYNSGRFIGQSIESIINQSYPNWELLVTDDCSDDDTAVIVSSFAKKDSRVRLFVLDKNSGPGVARNNSIKEAKGRYIAFCDSDDKWLPNKLEKQIELMERKHAACCYGAYYECREDGKRISVLNVRPVLSFLQEKHANQIGMLSGIYDSSIVGKQFMPTIRKRQDWALWLSIMRKCGKAVGITEPIAEYRIRSNSVSRNKASLVKYNAAIYKEFFHYPTWLSYLYTIAINIPTILLKRVKMNRRILTS